MSSNKDINLAIVGEDLTKKSTDSAGRNFDGLQRKVDGFSTKKPSKEVEDFSRLVTSNLKDGETAWQSVQREVGNTQTKVTDLRKEFARTGNASIFGDLKGAESDLKSLMNISESMGGKFVKEGQAAGEDAATGFGDSFSKMLPDVLSNPYTAAALVGAVALAAPGISAEIGAAVGAGFGLGVIGLGALSLKNNVDVKGAFSGLKDDLSSTFDVAAQPLVGPLVSGLTELGNAVKADGPELKQLFTAAEPAATALFAGVKGFGDEILPFLVSGMHDAAPLVEELAKDLPGLGASLGVFLDLLASSPGTVDALHDTFAVLDGTLELLGGTLYNLSNTWHNDVQVPLEAVHGWVQAVEADFGLLGSSGAGTGDLVSTALQGVTTATNYMASTVNGQAVPAWSELTTTLGQATASADTFAQSATDKIISTLLSADHATLSWNESLTNLKTTLHDNKDALNLHSAAGQADREAILASVSANVQQYDSMIQAGSSAKDAAAAYDSNTAALKKTLEQLGVAPSKVQDLIGKYEAVPDTVNTDVTLGKLGTVLDEIDTLLKKLLGLEDPVTIPVHFAVNESAINHAMATIHRDQASVSDAGNHWLRSSDPGDGGGGGTQAPRETTVTTNVSSSLVLDGKVISRSLQRAQSHQRHAARVGRRFR